MERTSIMIAEIECDLHIKCTHFHHAEKDDVIVKVTFSFPGLPKVTKAYQSQSEQLLQKHISEDVTAYLRDPGKWTRLNQGDGGGQDQALCTAER